MSEAGSAVTAATDSSSKRLLSRITTAEWILCVLTAAVCFAALCKDFRGELVLGDQASHAMQILSLAYDYDLRYTGKDVARWEQIGWTPTPQGLIYRSYSGGLAFAKSYLYSAAVAPLVRIFGLRFGVAVANCLIFIGLILLLFGIARQRFDRAVSALLVIAVAFASNVYFYVFPVHPDLFQAALSAAFCYSALRQLGSPDPRWFFVTAALFGIAISEKLLMLFLLVPVFLVLLVRLTNWWQRLAGVAIATAVFAICALPYLHYSDYQTWTAYGGTRLYSGAGAVLGLTGEPSDVVWVEPLLRGLYWPAADYLRSAYYYFVGAYTGLLVFAPAALLLGVASAWSGRNRSALLPWTIGIGLLIAGCIIYDPHNYFGGEQAVGNRWFLIVVPLALAVPVVGCLASNLARWSGIAAIFLSGLFIYPHHLDPMHAFQRCDRSGWLQRFFPLEVNQRFTPNTVARETNAVNISLLPQPPQWQMGREGDRQAWLWQNGQMIEAGCVDRYGRVYVETANDRGLAMFESTDSHSVYVSYHLGLAGEFILDRKHASIVVGCDPGHPARLWLLPMSDITTTATLSTSGSRERITLPAILTFVAPAESTRHLSKFDLVADDYLWVARVDETSDISAFEHRIELR